MPNKTAILLVHGMGTHKKGVITQDFKVALTDRANSFGLNPPDFLSKVDYFEFNYSDYLDVVRNQIVDNNAARTAGFKTLEGKGFESSLVNQLLTFESKFGKDDFFYTDWLDVILYGTSYFGEKIRLDFISQFEALAKKYKHRNIHLISHSLGTAVVHDALAKFYRKESDPFDDIPDLKTGNFNLASYWTFANVSRMVNLLNGLSDPNHSTVVTGSEGCTRNFITVRHQYDPFTWFKTYDRKMKERHNFVNKTIKNINTHNFYEYITEPNVARAILSFIYDQDIEEAAFKQGLEAYKVGSLSAETAKLKQLIDGARKDPAISDLKKAIKKYKQIHAEIKKQLDA